MVGLKGGDTIGSAKIDAIVICMQTGPHHILAVAQPVASHITGPLGISAVVVTDAHRGATPDATTMVAHHITDDAVAQQF